MRNARRIVASVLGISAGIAGIEHGYFEILQGNVKPDSVMIASIGPPCVPEEVWNLCEPAITLVPNFLVTGILAIILGLLVLVWAVAFVQTKHGGLVLIPLSVALLLVGGGLFPPLIGIVGGIVGAKIHSPLTWWRARSSGVAVRILAGLWPWALIVYLAWVFGQWVVGYFFNDWLMQNGFLIFLLVLGPLILSVFAGLAYDAQSSNGPDRARSAPFAQRVRAVHNRLQETGMQIYYFSGTGNSLHVARELRQRIPGTTLVPIISALASGRPGSAADAVGLVFPMHAFTFPLLVKQFLERADLRSASYLFAVATRECAAKVFRDIDRILAKQGKSLDAAFSFEMPQNYIPVFEPYSQDEIARTESELGGRLDSIQAVVTGRGRKRDKDGLALSLVSHTLFPVVRAFYHKTRYRNLERRFYSDSGCTGCGTCERVCLSGKIRITDNQPEWQDRVDCIFCLACLHYCPAHAIQISRSKTTTRGRYHHAEIGAQDIAGQRNWGE